MAVSRNRSWSFLQALIQICILTNLSIAHNIKVYSSYDFKGKDATVGISECTNLSNEMAKTVASVNTRGECASLYEKLNCNRSGRFIEVMARSPSHNNLEDWSFENRAMSVGPCRNVCDVGVVGENPKVDEQGELVIYKEKQFIGDFLKLNVQGCTRIPAQFVNKLSSVETFGKCFQLYNTIDCKLSGSNIDTIELRQGTPNHDDISTWYFPLSRSVSFCSHKCFERSKQDAICKPTKPNEVVFFEKVNYKGSCTSLTINKCTSKEGVIKSIKTFDSFCISLYDNLECTGKFLNIIGGIPDLSATFFSNTKSIQPCPIVTDFFRPSTGRSAKDLEVSISFPLIIVTIVSLIVFGVLITSLVVILIMRRYNPRRDILQKLTRKEIEEFIQGLGLSLGRDVEGGVDNDYSADLLAQNMPYNEEYEVPRCNIKFDPRTPLGMADYRIRHFFIIFFYSQFLLSTIQQTTRYNFSSRQESPDFSDDDNITSTKPNEGPIILIDENSSEANWTSHRVDNCVDFVNDWEDVTISFKMLDGLCVFIYEGIECKGDYFRAEQDTTVTFRSGTKRSVQPCTATQKVPVIDKTGDSEGMGDIQVSIPVIILATLALLLFGVVSSSALVLLIMSRCRPQGNAIEQLTPKEIEGFIKGLGMELGTGNAADVKKDEGNSDYSAELLAQNLPYDESLEVLRSDIKFDPNTPLGMGQFGIVYKGTYKTSALGSDYEISKGKTTQVAIKTVRPGSGPTIQVLRSLLKEVKIMLYVGKHDHIVQMVGCCTENLVRNEVLVMMEFCTNGSLESYLKSNRNRYENLIVKGRLDPTRLSRTYSNDSANHPTLYEPKQGNEKSDEKSQKEQQRFNFFQLLRWCTEIAEGMEYLTSRKVIHGDLAARNVLLDKGLQAKVSDFGLSRQLYTYNEYVKKHQEPLPWRWLAIESLKSMEFSAKSDVWAYGVTIWEVFTLGEKPYPGFVWNNDFLRNLEDGLRLTKPSYTVSECYNLMVQCWNENPTERPGFSDVLEELRDISTSLQVNKVTDNPNYRDYRLADIKKVTVTVAQSKTGDSGAPVAVAV